MSDLFNPEARDNKTFELVPEGKHTGIIRFAVDCGHHRDMYEGTPTVKHLIYIGWELDCKDSEGNNHWKGEFYTATDFINSKTGKPDFMFHKNSSFNKILRSWTGEDADKVKWQNFVGDLIAREVPCTITIEHTQDKKDPTKTYSNIESVKPYKGTGEPKRVNPFVGYRIGQPGLEDLPSLIRNKINKSIEVVEGSYTIPPKSASSPAGAPSQGDDDFPPF